MNRTFHAWLYIVTTAFGSWFLSESNTQISTAFAVVIGVGLGLIAGRLVIQGFEAARQSSPGGRFIIGAIWGAPMGLALLPSAEIFARLSVWRVVRSHGKIWLARPVTSQT